MTTDTELLLQLAREAERRYHGKYRGLVADNDDPQRRGRLRVKVPSVPGERTTAWALPCVPGGGSADAGLLAVPEVGAEVWVEFEMGDPDHPIWVGAFWSAAPDGGDGDLGDWRVRTWRTVGGQVVRLDDTEGDTSVTVRHGSGARIHIDDGGTVTIDDGHGDVVTLDSSGRLLIEDANGNSVRLSSSGIEAADAAGNSVELGAAGVTVSGTSVTVDAQVVELGGAGGEPVLKGSSFLGAYMAHTHGTGVGPSSPPIPTTESMALSSTVMTR